MKKGFIKKFTIILTFLLFFGLFFGTLIHELIGHSLTATIFGVKVTKVCVLFIEISANNMSLNLCHFGATHFQTEDLNDINYGFITIMGSVSTFIISLISSFILLFKTKLHTYKKYILIILSLYFIDIIYMFLKLYLKRGDFYDILNYLSINLFSFLPIV